MWFKRNSPGTDEPEPKALPEAAPEAQQPTTPKTSARPAAVAPPITEKRDVALLKKEDVDQAPTRPASAGALLGRGSRFEGKLTFEGTVQIDGEFDGEIHSKGHLEVGKDARVQGKIDVGSATVSGSVGGTVTTSGPLELRSTARVKGDLVVESLVVEKGAVFDGSVKMNRGSVGAAMAGAPPRVRGDLTPD